MYSTGGVADRFAHLVSKLESRLSGPLPAAVRFWDGSEFGPGEPGTVDDTIVIRNKRGLTYVVMRPDQVGIARGWVSGDIELEGDLERVMMAGSKLYGFDFTPREKLEAARIALAVGAVKIPPPKPPETEARVAGRLHSLRRDREAISHHYDVSNEFYRLILGPTMVYSCAYFASEDDTIEEAQTRKLDVICRKLELKPGERLLDIGCGWGSLLIHAASNYGVRAVGVTLSEEQAKLARDRISAAGLSDMCEVRIQDYREVTDGPYDKISSVGMYEHVGSSQLDNYMETVKNLGRPGGLALHHGICRMQNDDEQPNTFITRYVFPDGELHRVATVVAALEKSGQEMRDAESLREHYALTLKRWVRNLADNKADAISQIGEERERIWRLYMTASIGAFERGDVAIHQIVATIPGAKHELPLVRPGFVQPVPEVNPALTE
ncbi:MAG: class I SAM-dependent methyltransferase [Solirubrobacterales bacterium]|nr:class I SAM-dependent methyltransferase [Solirubrobacterales bacterium]